MTLANAFNRVVTIPRVAFALLLLVGLVLFRDSIDPTAYYHPKPLAPPTPPNPTSDALSLNATIATAPSLHASTCLTAPGASKVLILLKTGATELYSKLPTHLLTLFKCTPHYMLFSDLEQTYSGFRIHDALAPVSQDIRDHHEDFELYRKLLQYQREGQDVGLLKGDTGWNLDKWKFLPMLFRSFEEAPEEIEWFVMIEADTSVSWNNLLLWLATMKGATKPYYLGAQNVIGDTTFAHGGSGVIISRQAARQLQAVREKEGKEAYDKRWESLTAESCCGDEIIARALLEANVPLTPTWPVIQGETVATLDWTASHWCSVAITWHHVAPIELDALWQFQTQWVDEHGWKTPYLYRDVYEHFIDRHVSVNRSSWNNLSQDKKFITPHLAEGLDEDLTIMSDWEQRSVESQDACAAACEKMRDWGCLQWMFSPGRCYVGRVMRFGKSDEREEAHWTSGWMGDRIAEFKKEFEHCNPKWKGVGG
ncbi:hypothetical protein B0A48_14516 [Cryoendolithus antarcticus]|uniref:Glycosyltransferase family 31 protein n=1 Tax=Cryoendolithus antarcticus TaxID=1507870 RepID=A0A1V8SKQ3_9PEZI|nr:hypothetical protein B0A48_14516 [Cryoendolithus antarcticus]